MSSSLIDVLHRPYGGIDLPCPSGDLSELASLTEVVDRLPDPRRVRGGRYRPGALLAL
ncbi:hypothetical protein OG730_25420 [Streptomyces sp. NBC_01298]|uniref:hypothetical protein n=1 Tax=Streptomyces sp. NBC_01298 TaxID=2903817 RepID=UPI002E15577D|nr:hypothetical protein OG730_25420 [Streptomyces sp. NBC_01298]